MDFSGLALESPRLILRSYVDSDAGEVFDAVTPSLCRYMTFDPSPDLDAFRAIGRSWGDAMAQGTMVVFAVRRSADEEFLGLTGLHGIGEGLPEAGIWIKEAAHRQGFGLEATARLVRWAGDELRLRYIAYSAAADNAASRRLAERLGGVETARPTVSRASGEPLPSVQYRVSATPSPAPDTAVGA